jgi:hypothetical protein
VEKQGNGGLPGTILLDEREAGAWESLATTLLSADTGIQPIDFGEASYMFMNNGCDQMHQFESR